MSYRNEIFARYFSCGYGAAIALAALTTIAHYSNANAQATRNLPAQQSPSQQSSSAPADGTCRIDDFSCAVVEACKMYKDAASAESRALFPKCIERKAREIGLQRQQVLAARMDVKGKEALVYFGKNYGADDNHGDWCGKNLWGKIEYPDEFNVLPSLAKTTGAIINATLSRECPQAETVMVSLHLYTDKFGPHQTWFSGQYLEVYKDSDIWNANLHPDYVQTLVAKANLRSLWTMISNPTQLGYFGGMISINDAAARSAQTRYAIYAREGKVCKMREPVKHCYVSTTYTPTYGGSIGRTTIINQNVTHVSSCQEPCENHEGYCNMETGARYPTAEAAERANCREASQEEIDRAIASVQVNGSVNAYSYEVLYLPWHAFAK